MPDDRENGSQDGSPPRPPGANGSGHRRREFDRLPPPAFPPEYGSVRHRPTAENRGFGAGSPDDGVPDDAFILPDETSGWRLFEQDPFAQADGPSDPEGEEVDPDDVLVTGIGDDPHLGREEITQAGHREAQLADLTTRVRRLADALETKGEIALRATAEMSRFDATLRAYCLGYLVAQRGTKSD